MENCELRFPCKEIALMDRKMSKNKKNFSSPWSCGPFPLLPCEIAVILDVVLIQNVISHGWRGIYRKSQ